ncbi:MAG: hypothetical protein Kow0059_03460 [Candidatus Sumerlaeia bacterium]
MNPSPKNILLLGVGPIPPQKAVKTYAPGWYTWALAQMIRDDGHCVRLRFGRFGGGAAGDDGGAPLSALDLGERLSAVETPLDPARASVVLQEELDRHQPDAIVAYTDVMANAACRLRTKAPRYIIYYGHPMAERQMQAAAGGSDVAVADQWLMILPALLGGDRFGATSRAQQSAMFGELGAVGRLNRHTVAAPLVDHLATALLNDRQSGRAGQIKGTIVPSEAVMVLWLGGYNTWSDEQTLFGALQRVMEADPRVHYVSCGGEIKGHVEQVYARFQERVAASPYRDRFHLLGWRRWDELGDFFADADCAVCTDLPTLEGRFGARTRILDLLLNETPVVTNAVDEATEELANLGFLTLTAPGDAEALAQALLNTTRDPLAAREHARAASRHLRSEWIPRKRWIPLLEWLRSPRPAPDLTLSMNEWLAGLKIKTPFHLPMADNSLSRSQALFLAALSQPSDSKTLARRLKNALRRIIKQERI